MTAFGFKARFCQPCIDETKGGTIRDDRKDGRALAKVGGMIQFYTAMRTPSCRKIMPDRPCLEVQKIVVNFEAGSVHFPAVSLLSGGGISSMHLHKSKVLTAFARFDGFQDFSEMELFWMKERGKKFQPVYTGNHIRWLPWPDPIAELLA